MARHLLVQPMSSRCIGLYRPPGDGVPGPIAEQKRCRCSVVVGAGLEHGDLVPADGKR